LVAIPGLEPGFEP